MIVKSNPCSEKYRIRIKMRPFLLIDLHKCPLITPKGPITAMSVKAEYISYYRSEYMVYKTNIQDIIPFTYERRNCKRN
jgi:hypothetical protein